MVYILLADGFEEIEVICPLDIMLRAGITVKTVSVSNAISVAGAHGIVFNPDLAMNTIDPECPQLIMLPGGMPGAKNLYESNEVRNLITGTFARDAYIAAICAAPFILGKMGLLNGRTAICYPGFEKDLAGATISDKNTVRDGNIITAAGPGAAISFGLEIVKALKGEKIAADIKAGLLA